MLTEMIEHFQQSPNQSTSVVEKYPKYLTKYSLMSLQKDDSALKMVFCIQVLILLQTLSQPILIEQKRDIKLTDDDRSRLGILKLAIFKMIDQDRLKSSGSNIAKIVMELEPQWC